MNAPRRGPDTAARVVIPAAITGCLAVPVAVLASRLPDPVAVSWGALAGGRAVPRAHLPVWIWAAAMVVLWCCAWAALKPFARPFPRQRERAFGVYTVAGLLLTGDALVLGLNDGKPSWRESGASTVVLVSVLAAGGILTLAAGWAGWLLARAAEPAVPAPPLRPRAPGQLVVWHGRASNRWLLLVAAGVLLAAVLISGTVPRLLVGLAAAAGLAAFSEVSVTVGPRGVTSALGPWRWPRRHVTVARIRAARPFQLKALAYRGWGWRWVPRGSAWIIRSGDALELDLHDGRRFAVTVDQAADAAALINGYLPAAPDA